MSAERHARLTAAFLETHRKAPAERELELDRLAAEDAELGADLRELLAVHDGPSAAKSSWEPAEIAQVTGRAVGPASRDAAAAPVVQDGAPDAPDASELEGVASDTEIPKAPVLMPILPGLASNRSEGGGSSASEGAESDEATKPKAPTLMSALPEPLTREPASSTPPTSTSAVPEPARPESVESDSHAPDSSPSRPGEGRESDSVVPGVDVAALDVFTPRGAPESGVPSHPEPAGAEALRAPRPTRSMRHPGRRSLFWPLAAAAALIVAAAGWTVPLVSPARMVVPETAAAPAAESPEAELVRAFFVSALAEPDPAASGRDASMTAWLDRVGKDLESRFADRPEVKASLHGVLGQAFTGLRLYGEAEKHYRAMLEIRRNALGPMHRATLDAIACAGCALLEQGRRLDEAEQLLREGHRERLSRFGAEDADTLASRVHLARLHAKRAEIEAAERIFEDVLKVARRVLGSDHAVTLDALERYALFLLGLNRTAEAAPKVEEVHGRYVRRYGKDHPRTAAMLNALATTYSRRGDDPKAEKAFRSLLRHYLDQFGKEHQKTLFARLNLGIVLEKKKDFAAAEEQFRQAVEVHRRFGVLDPPVLVTAATRWARVLARLGHLDQAAAEFGRIDALVARLYGAGDGRLHHFRAERGDLLTSLGRFSEAERVLRKNHRWLNARPGGRMPPRDDYLAPLVRLYEKWGKDREAARIRSEIERRTKADR